MDGETLRIIRTSNKLTIREFASKLCVSHSLISRIEGGDRRVTKRMKNKVMYTFNMTEEKLVAINLLINEIKI
ncbi:helix-turn-helix domain-containing protein [Cytobacillus kochii]|uniref:helix-turn-helix domain-containing protein n=1 Tax=Cytobacillus kochii TaxID=859143 RepID=UPI001CD49AC8|nr:helix-turn-helix transcriptional regulator [Cytobacillus kochii]MCA1027827.1 helix-turn-helix domain-containing protein [Cytobacillus kochii]